jgi:UDP:flavonoid glycosyltransferase YjiC (YdhE family)
MARFLFVVPPLVGHINPTVAVAAHLVEAGHEVAWAGQQDYVLALAGPSATIFHCAAEGIERERPAGMRGPAALQYLWEKFIVPLADEMTDGVEAAIDAFGPDVVIADQQAIAGALIAERRHLPWITSATTSAELTDPLSGLPKVKQWVEQLIGELRDRIGAPGSTHDPRFSPHGILAFTTEALVGPYALGSQPVWAVGPALVEQLDMTAFPWDLLDQELPTVLVSLGTVSKEIAEEFLVRAAEAVQARKGNLQAVIVDPGGHLDGVDAPNIVTAPFVPQRELLPFIDAVVCHAGHNTVCEALWHGLPLVVAPIRDDQPVIADQVVRAGAGVRIRFNRVTAAHIGDAIDAVLDVGNGHQRAAAAVGQSFRDAGGAATAAQHLARFAGE